jgi:hypothetical protein
MLDPKINGPQADSIRTRLDVGAVDALGRHRRDPNTRKDFKKVLEGESESGEISEAETQAKVRASKARGKSIFDVQAGATQVRDARGDLADVSPKSAKSNKKQKTSDYTESRGDLSSLDSERPTNLQALQRQSFDIESGASGSSSSDRLSLQQIVDQIVDSLYILKRDGQTETVVMLKHPPELTGSELVLTSFSQAKGEFNIAIHNLTQAGQLFLEQNNIKLGLRQALEEHGYAVHIITTTTQPFTTIATESTESARKDRQNREDDNQQNKEKNR